MQLSQEDPRTELLWLKVYKEFIEAIDGIDNGVSRYPSELKPSYRLKTDVSARVGYLNPRWNAQPAPTSQDYDSLFQKASDLVGGEFHERLDYYGTAWLPARELVLDAIQKSYEDGENDGRVVIFESFVPWKVISIVFPIIRCPLSHLTILLF